MMLNFQYHVALNFWIETSSVTCVKPSISSTHWHYAFPLKLYPKLHLSMYSKQGSAANEFLTGGLTWYLLTDRLYLMCRGLYWSNFKGTGHFVRVPTQHGQNPWYSMYLFNKNSIFCLASSWVVLGFLKCQ